MHLGTVYLIANDFEKSIIFYEQLLEMPVTSRNMERFAQFAFEGCNIAIMNGHFDAEHPDKVVQKGISTPLFEDFREKALAPNTHKFVLNFCVKDMKEEYKRIKKLELGENLSEILYVCNASPYYYFCLTDPDENIIEITGAYMPEKGMFSE